MAWHLPGTHFLRILVRNRSLIYQLVRRDFETRYVGSAAGWLWGVIHPLVLLVVYTFVFAYALGVKPPPGEVVDSYPLWLFAGMLPWLLFSESLQRSAAALPEYANLIKKSVFPSEVVPLTIFLSNLISHFLGIILLVIATAASIGQWNWTIVAVPGLLILLGMLTVGLSWIAAGLHVYLRDTAQVLMVLLTAWFWLTPIFLHEGLLREKFSGHLSILLYINPMTYAVRAYRDAFLGNTFPAWGDWATFAAFAVTTFVIGGLFFRHSKRGFADVL
ncbi:MAG TPA: ABC transporter permease [Bryobacterales bacterium]|nr:ABC transporter permease [Bryobacterales bacterium]